MAANFMAALAASACMACCADVRFLVETPGKPEPWESTAAEELRHYLELVALDGRISVDGRNGVVLHVGNTSFAADRGLGRDTFKDEEWCIRSFGPDVVLAGGGTRGTLYAVSHFLEDECGIHWWYDGDEDVPPAKPLDLGRLDRRGRPHFAFREIYRGDSPSDFRTAVRNRLNGNGRGKIPLSWGGGIATGSPHHCHVWDRYVPYGRYGSEHPEWFSLHGGVRTGGMSNGQLCLTNPEVLDMLEKGVRRSIGQDRLTARAEGVSEPRIYDLSMNDNMKFCQCPDCAAETARYGHSGLQLKMANEIARRISADHPGLFFTTLAYLYSEPAPAGGMRAADNVMVRLCNTRQNMAAGMDEDCNAFMRRMVRDWNAAADNLFIWDYAIIYRRPVRGFPFASEFHIPGKYRFYAGHNVTGVFIEHEDHDSSDMYELKYFLECRMLEEPFGDAGRLVEDFMRLYYGSAGGKILESRRMLDRIRREKGGFVTWFPSFSEFNFIDDGDIAAMSGLFDAAAGLVKGDARREMRVARARASMDRLRDYRMRFGRLHPPEEGVASRPFYDFPVDLGDYAFDRHDRTGKRFRLVSDPDLGGRKAWRLDARTGGYGLPFTFGVYDFLNRKLVAKKEWDRPLGRGYVWYDLGEVDLPQSFIVYFTRQWSIDIPAGAPGLNGGRFRVKAQVKMTGPGYFGDASEPDAIYLARVVFESAAAGQTAAGDAGLAHSLLE